MSKRFGSTSGKTMTLVDLLRRFAELPEKGLPYEKLISGDGIQRAETWQMA